MLSLLCHKVIEFLEQEQRPGLPELDIGAFRKLVQRFCQLTNLPLPEVGCPHYNCSDQRSLPY